MEDRRSRKYVPAEIVTQAHSPDLPPEAVPLVKLGSGPYRD